MNKIVCIGWTEYLNAVRSKAFLIGVLLLPVMMFGSVFIQKFAANKADVRDRRVAIVDPTQTLAAALASKAKSRNESEIFEWKSSGRGRQIRPRFLLEEFHTESATREPADLILSERVRRKDLFAFIIIGTNALSAEGGSGAEISYFTQTPTFTELPDWLERTLNAEIQLFRFRQANIDSTLVRKLTRGTAFKKLGLAEVAPSGEIIKAKEENKAATFAVPAGAMFLLYLLVMSSAPALLNTVLEEKMQKISEVLISSVSPFQLMLGKLAGAILTSLTLSVLYLGAIGFFLWRNGLGQLVPISLYFWFFLFQLLALIIYGSMLSAIGAACTEIKDAQNMMLPAMLMILIPVFTWLPVMQSPTSNFSRLISLFPPATPLLMMLRIAIPPGPPWWEIALGVLGTVGFMLVCVWASGKIFRTGILSQGQSASIGKLVKWVLSR